MVMRIRFKLIFVLIFTWLAAASESEATTDNLLNCEKQLFPLSQEAVWTLMAKGQVKEANDQLSQLTQTLQFDEILRVRRAELRFRIIDFRNGIRAIAKTTGVANAVATYHVDHQLLQGRAKVPLTVKRVIDDQTFSIQLWVKRAQLSPTVFGPYLLFLDLLTDNHDRCPGHNSLATEHTDCIAIDNEFAFDHSGPTLLWADYNCRGLELSLNSRGADLNPLRECLERHGTNAQSIAHIAKGISAEQLTQVLSNLDQYLVEAAVDRLKLLQNL